MSAELVPVSVPGTDRTIMASLINGKPMVSIRHACMAIGLEPARQIQKLNSRSWAGCVHDGHAFSRWDAASSVAGQSLSTAPVCAASTSAAKTAP